MGPNSVSLNFGHLDSFIREKLGFWIMSTVAPDAIRRDGITEHAQIDDMLSQRTYVRRRQSEV